LNNIKEDNNRSFSEGRHAENTYYFDYEVECYIPPKKGNQGRKRKAGAPAVLGYRSNN
jgi:hypothetical protein